MMMAYQQRVIKEKGELDSRLEKLNTFFPTALFEGLPSAEKERMRRQAEAMQSYSNILGERIEAF